MVTLDVARNYCRATDEDDALLERLILSAQNYMDGAIDGFSSNYESASWQGKADMAMLQIIANWYEFREASDDIPKNARLIINQLQLEKTT